MELTRHDAGEMRRHEETYATDVSERGGEVDGIPPPENRLFYPALDGLRGFALMLVFCQHYLELPWGWTGVDLFFVLSGFLITGILYDSRERAGRVRTFYMRRTLRIFPLYYGVLLLLLLSTPVLHWQWSAFWWAWPAYLGNYLRFLQFGHATPALAQAMFGDLTQRAGRQVVVHVGHFWSLCVEEQFYLVWPWVVFAVRDRRRLMLCCVAAVLLAPVARVVAAAVAPPYFMEPLVGTVVLTPLRADALLLGGLLALLLRGAQARWVMRAARWCGWAALPLLALLLVRTLHPHRIYAYPAGTLTWGITLADGLAAVLVLLSLDPGSWVYRVFTLRPLRWLGRISYGAYLFHDLPHEAYVGAATWIGASVPFVGVHVRTFSAMLALPCTLVLAALSFRYFETPILRWKERLAPA